MRIEVGAAAAARLFFSIAQHAEALGSVRVLRRPTGRPQLDRWRAATLRGIPDRAQPLLDVVLPPGPVPDFLAPEDVAANPSHRVAQEIRQTPREQIATQLGHLAGRGRWLSLLVGGDAQAMAELTRGIQAYGDECFTPRWHRTHVALATEVARRRRQLAEEGTAAVLGSLSPGVGWDEPFLTVPALPPVDVRLGGRPLRLVPSVHWTRPCFMTHGYRSPTLVYPVGCLRALDGDDDPLAALMGRTRAGVARALVVGLGTRAVADRVGISVASASEHAAVLRSAGLASTERRGQSVRHILTPAGLHLVRTAAPAG